MKAIEKGVSFLGEEEERIRKLAATAPFRDELQTANAIKRGIAAGKVRAALGKVHERVFPPSTALCVPTLQHA
jgi:hypothetical protein